MKTTHFFAILTIYCLGLASCKDKNTVDRVQGYKPVYLQTANIQEIIKSGPASELREPGKIYTKGDFLYINEKGKGIHIIDNANPSAPVNTAFINIPSSMDIAIKDDILYADYAGGLLAINISDPASIKVLKYIPSSDQTPPSPPSLNNGNFSSGRTYFECVDASKGYVSDWELADLESPKCYK